MKTLTKQNNQLDESLATIKARLKRNVAELQETVRRATYNINIAIGRDLNKVRHLFKHGEWMAFLREVSIDGTAAVRTMKMAADLENRGSPNFKSTTEHLRKLNPNYATPRQRVDEQPVRNILAGIDSKIFAERAKNEAKEGRLKKSMALELVDAGYRALSIKAHSDKGGSDDAMRRLGEVRKALKAAITDGTIPL